MKKKILLTCIKCLWGAKTSLLQRILKLSIFHSFYIFSWHRLIDVLRLLFFLSFFFSRVFCFVFFSPFWVNHVWIFVFGYSSQCLPLGRRKCIQLEGKSEFKHWHAAFEAREFSTQYRRGDIMTCTRSFAQKGNEYSSHSWHSLATMSLLKRLHVIINEAE